jgi:hypothetical protein
MPWKRRFYSYCEDFLGQIFSCIGIDVAAIRRLLVHHDLLKKTVDSPLSDV